MDTICDKPATARSSAAARLLASSADTACLPATDMINYAYKNAYDTAIIVTGDGDFVSAVTAVKDAGKHVENAYFKAGCSRHLLQTCDTFTELTKAFVTNCK